MILVMMARAGLFHTGREIKIFWWINVSFVLLNIVVVQGVLWSIYDESKFLDGLSWSSGLWVLAFCDRLTIILLAERPDGKTD